MAECSTQLYVRNIQRLKHKKNCLTHREVWNKGASAVPQQRQTGNIGYLLSQNAEQIQTKRYRCAAMRNVKCVKIMSQQQQNKMETMSFTGMLWVVKNNNQINKNVQIRKRRQHGKKSWLPKWDTHVQREGKTHHTPPHTHNNEINTTNRRPCERIKTTTEI